MAIGALPNISIGQSFNSRRDLYDAGVHRTLEGGIVGRSGEGAESIVLSGGYADDEDYGETIIYTGFGGRDRGSGRQVADQAFTRQNQALVMSALQGLPLRVVRGSGHQSPFSPQSGFRYDGLFRVERYWQEYGRDGFLVCRCRLVMEQVEASVSTESATGTSAKRIETNI